MPSYFDFQPGVESHGPVDDSTPLLGRFRAVPNSPSFGRRSYTNKLLTNLSSTGTLARGFTNTFEAENFNDDEDCLPNTQESGTLKRWRRVQEDLWLEPKQAAVSNLMGNWWSRAIVLIVLPAALVGNLLHTAKILSADLAQPVAWCAIPFPKQDLPYDWTASREYEDFSSIYRTPGHGAARVEINFWYFLFVYYGLYNLTALVWITKVFNIYNFNWSVNNLPTKIVLTRTPRWPEQWGFPVTISSIAVFSVAVPIPIYYIPTLRGITSHNTAWICWTFLVMSIPLLFAITSLVSLERHVGLRTSLSQTQRIFTSSWWTGDIDTISRRSFATRGNIQEHVFESNLFPNVALLAGPSHSPPPNRNLCLCKRWIPASFMRFLWFSAALFIAMLAYVMGEAYAESYLRTLPHSTPQTIVYIYTWVLTVHLLDGLVGWILGGGDGQRVGSYPLGWTFKLYFCLTYQTYVRALYARLRSPSQFLVLQIISSSILIFMAPLTMGKYFHYTLTVLSINGQSLSQYQKFCARNIYIRSLSECVSMVAFLGSILVLHYGANKDVYPYFAFDETPDQKLQLPCDGVLPKMGNGEGYDFGLTFYASIITFACEIVAGWIVRRIIWFGWQIDVTDEAIQDLSAWPEMLPTVVIVMVHVLQNMLFSIVRLRFY